MYTTAAPSKAREISQEHTFLFLLKSEEKSKNWEKTFEWTLHNKKWEQHLVNSAEDTSDNLLILIGQKQGVYLERHTCKSPNQIVSVKQSVAKQTIQETAWHSLISIVPKSSLV